jgi:deoxycytidylate deaminase
VRELLKYSRRDQKFLDLAFKIASLSTCTQKHGAVIVKGGRVMAVGINKDRNDPGFVASDTAEGAKGTIFSVHAEMMALAKVKDPRGAILYVARRSRTGLRAFSRPCDNCTKALIKAGVKSVVYT